MDRWLENWIDEWEEGYDELEAIKNEVNGGMAVATRFQQMVAVACGDV